MYSIRDGGSTVTPRGGEKNPGAENLYWVQISGAIGARIS